MRKRNEANARTLPTRTLECAISACGQSEHASDRLFAQECRAEMARRFAEVAQAKRRCDGVIRGLELMGES